MALSCACGERGEFGRLWFDGAEFPGTEPGFGGGIQLTAVGGCQHIRVTGESGLDGANTADPSIATATLRTGADDATAQLSGHRAGHTTLRIFRGRRLIDQVSVTVDEITGVRLHPMPERCAGAWCPTQDRFALLSSERARLFVWLAGRTGRLVDECMGVRVGGEPRGSGDSVWIEPERLAGRSQVTVDIETGDGTHSFDLPVTSTVDALVVSDAQRPFVESGDIYGSESLRVCVEAFADGVWVANAALSWEAEPPLEVTPQWNDRCPEVRFTEPGEGVLRVSAPGAELTLPFRSVP